MTIDRNNLRVPYKLNDDVINATVKNKLDETDVKITIKYRRVKQMKDSAMFYNLLFKQIMRKLEYKQFGQKLFDPSQPKLIPQHELTIWPGYVTAVDEYDDGLMLMLDVSHRVICNRSIYDLMRRIHYSCEKNKQQNFKDLFQKSIIGSIVMTTYSDKAYTIHGIDFDKKPTDTFEGKDGNVTFVDYYKTNHKVEIQDLSQPLLVSYKDRKIGTNGKIEGDTITFALIPELCRLTGLTDEMRSDNKVCAEHIVLCQLNYYFLSNFEQFSLLF